MMTENEKLEDLKKVRKYTQRGCRRVQMLALRERIDNFIDAGISFTAMYKLFSHEGSFSGILTTFCRGIREDLPDIYEKYLNKKNNKDVYLNEKD